ncbi:MAG: 50S ribosomal protein L13, partial [Deltaproteobacteria bacterium]|nr:50S ribosomal protein L13 [Deltaproteobacteria bacterium]
MKMTSFYTREDANQEWHVVDAQDQVLGRLATRVSSVLRGKHKPAYTPNADVGDFVIVVNADKVRLTGKKMADKSYYRHTGYIGGLK